MLSNKPKFPLLVTGLISWYLEMRFLERKVFVEDSKKQCVTKSFVNLLLSNKAFHGCFHREIIKLARFICNF